MMKTSFINGIIIGFSLFGRTIYAETKTAKESTPSPRTNEAPKNEPQSTNQTASSYPAGGSQCQPHELLFENRCVDRVVFLNPVKMRTGKDEGFDKVNETISMIVLTNCKVDEGKSSLSCEKAVVLKTRDELRDPVVNSTLNSHNTVVHSSPGPSSPQKDRNGDDELEQRKMRKMNTDSDDPVTDKDRARMNKFLLKRLRKAERCRLNDALGCIRRRHQKFKANDKAYSHVDDPDLTDY
ncbi:hypothetical protein KR038_009635 [Drosophila bunnanda]|nr:hypothetical protein KR038_009635 [Drosophila bunnanda]